MIVVRDVDNTTSQFEYHTNRKDFPNLNFTDGCAACFAEKNEQDSNGYIMCTSRHIKRSEVPPNQLVLPHSVRVKRKVV